MGAESELQPMPPSLELAGGAASDARGSGGGDKCAIDEWEGVLSGSVSASPSQEHYWMMGDVEDPTINTFQKVLQTNDVSDLEFNTLFGNVDQGFGTDPGGLISSTSAHVLPTINSPNFLNGNFKIGSQQHPMFPSLPNNLGPVCPGNQMQNPFVGSEMKAPTFLPQLMMNHHQTQQPQNPSFFFPLSFASQDQNVVIPPQAKRHNPGVVGGLEKELLIGRQQQQQQQQEVSQGFPQQLQMMPLIGMKPKMVGDEMGQSFQQQLQHQQQAIIDQLFKAAELIQAGNLVLAQEILARLNHQLSPIGKPFHRASFYFKEALQLLLHNNNSGNPSSIHTSPFGLVFKIGAYKSLSEISPLLQFANFTCNQAILEELGGFERIHVIDFDIGYGGQWASFMQELSLRSGGAPRLKITAFASPSTHDQLELELVRDNLIQFASEINMVLEFDITNIDSLNSGSWPLQHVSDNDAVAVNLPVTSFSNSHLPLALVLRCVKQLSPKVVVSVDRGCDRTDLPFPNHVIHALQSYCNLLESLDAVNVNPDALQKIERFLAQPGIEKIVMGRYRFPEKTQHWRTLFLSAGFSPLTFSNVTETQAECIVKRTPVRGFHVEKRQSSLVLCWQQKELISATAWRS